VTSGNAMKIRFHDTDEYDGGLKITVRTKTPFSTNSGKIDTGCSSKT